MLRTNEALLIEIRISILMVETSVKLLHQPPIQYRRSLKLSGAWLSAFGKIEGLWWPLQRHSTSEQTRSERSAFSRHTASAKLNPVFRSTAPQTPCLPFRYLSRGWPSHRRNPNCGSVTHVKCNRTGVVIRYKNPQPNWLVC